MGGKPMSRPFVPCRGTQGGVHVRGAHMDLPSYDQSAGHTDRVHKSNQSRQTDWLWSREEIYFCHRGTDLLAQIDPSDLWHEELLHLTAQTDDHEDFRRQRGIGGGSRLVVVS